MTDYTPVSRRAYCMDDHWKAMIDVVDGSNHSQVEGQVDLHDPAHPRLTLPNNQTVDVTPGFVAAFRSLPDVPADLAPQREQICNGTATPAPAAPTAAASAPITWTLRGGPRATGTFGSFYTFGFQILGGPSIRVNPYFRIIFQLEWNNQFLGTDKPASSLSRDAILGSHFPGVRNSRFDGNTYTDVTGGTAVANQTYFMELIPEVHAMVRPVPDFPFEFGVRLGFGITYTNLHTRSTVNQSDPTTGHIVNGCIPGDIHCPQAPIPEASAGSPYGTFETDTGTWFTWARFGPRIAFPINDYFQTSTEFLFRSNATGGFDDFWRTNIRLAYPFLNGSLTLFLEPRYILAIPDGKPITHGFDAVGGLSGRF